MFVRDSGKKKRVYVFVCEREKESKTVSVCVCERERKTVSVCGLPVRAVR